jgi:hypothetical protein
MIEGIDYSRTLNADWESLAQAIVADGKRFTGRYPVNDKAPGGRGITGPEYRALMDAGVDVFLYWQEGTDWMKEGFSAGVRGAYNAASNIIACGIPEGIPVYFACDFDAYPHEQGLIDDCLHGAASIIGAERVGLYAGIGPLTRAKQNGSAHWFCQTSAWSGGRLMPGLHLYQYDYNYFINGTNCDLVRAYDLSYGQASDYIPSKYPAPILPPFYERVNAQDSPSRFEWQGNTWYPQRANVKARDDTYFYVEPNTKSPHAGPMIPKGAKIAVEWIFEDEADRGRLWLVNSQGYYYGAKYRPRLRVPETR